MATDGKRALSWSQNGALQLWDLATGRQIGQTMHHDDRVWARCS
jgi:hypothetical protein